MHVDSEALASEDRFFEALSRRDRDALERVLAEDFLMIDVLTGSEVPRDVFVDLVGSQQLIFDSIERHETRVRVHGDAAIVTGRTLMSGRYAAQAFQIRSRYTHVHIRDREGWRLVSAQGTPVVDSGPA